MDDIRLCIENLTMREILAKGANYSYSLSWCLFFQVFPLRLNQKLFQTKNGKSNVSAKNFCCNRISVEDMQNNTPTVSDRVYDIA